jgi:hypothetical protein
MLELDLDRLLSYCGSTGEVNRGVQTAETHASMTLPQSYHWFDK